MAHRFRQRLADVLAELGVGHAGGLGQHERGDAVLIHFLMAIRGDQAIGLLFAQHPANALLDGRAIASLAGHMAGGEESHDRKAGDGGIGTICRDLASSLLVCPAWLAGYPARARWRDHDLRRAVSSSAADAVIVPPKTMAREKMT